MSLILLQILAAIKNYQYSRMRILHMIGASYIPKQDKLVRKRNHRQMRRMSRKPRGYWYEKNRTEQWWFKMIDEEASASSWKKDFHMTKGSFMKLLTNISPLISPKLNSSNYRLLSCKHFTRLISLPSVHLKRNCEIAIFIFLKINKEIARLVSNFHPGLGKMSIIWKI